MGLELLGAGAGAGQGLEQLIAQRRADELMRQQALMHAMSAIGLREDRAARLGQQKVQADSLAASREDANRNRDLTSGLQLKQSLAPGTELGQMSLDRLVKSGAALPEEFNSSPGTPASLPSVSLSGMSAIGPRGPDSMAPQTQESSHAIDPSYRFKGTAQQQEKAAGLSSLDTSRKAAIDQATERAQQAWERLRVEGDSAAARSALAASMAEISRLRLENERQRTADAAAKTPQPQYFQDTQGATHAVIFDKGKFQEVPLPKGYTPTKATAPGFFDKIRGLFGGSDSAAQGVISNDPNWGK